MSDTETTTSTKGSGNDKKAFDFSRSSIWVCDPAKDLCIKGGAKLLKGAERGEADDDDVEHFLCDAERLAEPLDDAMVNNVDAYGVIEPIVIAKIDGKAVVVAGRTRVRWARVVNARRAKKGEPPIGVKCEQRRATSDVELLGVMTAENEVRRAYSLPSRIARVKQYLSRGVQPPQIAVTFGCSEQTITDLIKIDDNAIPAVKAKIADGSVSMSAARHLVRVKDPEEQREALRSLLAGPKASSTAAKRASKASSKSTKNEKGGDGVGVTARRDLRRMLDAAVAWDHRNASEKTMAWWEGVEDTLKAILGEECDERIARLIEKAGEE